MKTAEEWAMTHINICFNDPAVSGQQLPMPQFMALVQQIQLDAMKEGMRRAANEVEGFDFTESVTLAADLRAASEQLTIKDL